MSLDLITILSNALDDEVFEPFFAVDLLFDSPNQLYLWTGSYDTTIDGKFYVSTPNLLSFSALDETSEISARSATVTLSGVPSAVVSLALSTPYQGRRANIFMGLLSDPTQYSEVFSGYMDTMPIEEGPESSTIDLVIESRLVDLERPRVRKYSSENQKFRFPGDKGFDFVESIQDQRLPWGSQVDT